MRRIINDPSKNFYFSKIKTLTTTVGVNDNHNKKMYQKSDDHEERVKQDKVLINLGHWDLTGDRKRTYVEQYTSSYFDCLSHKGTLLQFISIGNCGHQRVTQDCISLAHMRPGRK